MQQYVAHYQTIKPDWVLVGVPITSGEQREPGVGIFASRTLPRATLTCKVEQVMAEHAQADFDPLTEYDVVVQFGDFELAVDTTYQGALRKIMQAWQPDSPTQDPNS